MNRLHSLPVQPDPPQLVLQHSALQLNNLWIAVYNYEMHTSINTQSSMTGSSVQSTQTDQSLKGCSKHAGFTWCLIP